MKWYKLYLEAQIRGVISTAYAYSGPMRLRALVVLAFARRDAAANQLRSREEFYAELKRLSAVSSLTTVTISSAGSIPILVVKALREIAEAKLTSSFDSSLKTAKDIVVGVRVGKSYTFKVRREDYETVVDKLCEVGARVEIDTHRPARSVSSLTTVTIISKGSNSIAVMKALREIGLANQTKSFDSSLKTVKDIVDQVIDGKPYTFKVRPQHRDAVVAKLRGAGAVVE